MDSIGWRTRFSRPPPTLGQLGILEQTAEPIVAGKSVQIAFELQHGQNSKVGAQGDCGISLLGPKACHLRYPSPFTGDIQAQVAPKTGTPQSLAERGEKLYLVWVQLRLLGWHIAF